MWITATSALKRKFRSKWHRLQSVIIDGHPETEVWATKKKGDLDNLRSPFLFRVFRAHDRKRSVAMLLKQAGRLSFSYFFSLWSFGPLRHFKFDFLALFEGLEAFAL